MPDTPTDPPAPDPIAPSPTILETDIPGGGAGPGAYVHPDNLEPEDPDA